MSWQDLVRAFGTFFFGTRDVTLGWHATSALHTTARTLQASHTRDKNKRYAYLQKLEEFLKAVDLSERYKIPVSLSTFGFSSVVKKDVSILLEIKKEKKANDLDNIKLDKIKLLVEQALKFGLGSTLVQHVVGDVIDIDLLKEESADEKLTKYIGQHNKACGICLDEFTKENFLSKKIHRTVCSHFFHNCCIEQWVNTKPECPNCRKKITLLAEKTIWQNFLTIIHKKIESHTFCADKQNATLLEQEDEQTLEARRKKEQKVNAREKEEQERYDHDVALRLNAELNGVW